jgi:ArsR family transcriptional regulator
MKNLLKVMKALSDPNRVKIVKMLQRQEMCVCELTAALEIAQSTVSSHLRILEEAGMVRSRKEGLWVNYLPADGGGNLCAAALLAGLSGWLADDPEIEALLHRLPTIRREDICCKK